MSEGYQDAGSVRSGCLIMIAAHLLQIPIAIILGFLQPDLQPDLVLSTIIFIGISQLVYMVPAIIYFSRKGRSESAKGMMIGAALTLLLSAARTGIFYGVILKS
ncbi:MAG: hypothetical protein ACLGJB_09315 [Blastocatellia bacterium]